MLISILKSFFCIVWGTLYYCLDEKSAAVMPLTYLCGVLSNFMLLMHSEGNYDRFVFYQLVLILVFPSLVHLVLGGLQASGGVMLWSFLAPLGAAFFRSFKESLTWFKVYMGLSFSLIVREYWVGSSATVVNSYWMMNILGVQLIVFATAAYFAQALEDEYNRSEMLLHNVLPQSIANRIRSGENPILDKHDAVSLLFADVVGFTTAASTMDPDKLIGFLEEFFAAVDEAAERRHLTKIKTIGDAYMCAGGLEVLPSTSRHNEQDVLKSPMNTRTCHSPPPPRSHVEQMLHFAVDMLQILQVVNKAVGTSFEIRIGIHVGPVIAGVLGVSRFAYDCWGDSVNTASRMESHGKPSCIHLSQDAYDYLRHLPQFSFTCAGTSFVKGKGEMMTYFVTPADQCGQ